MQNIKASFVIKEAFSFSYKITIFNIVIKAKRNHIIFLITGILLMIPLIAMQFTSEVNWNVMDFIIAGVLLMSTGLIINYIQRKLIPKKYRTLIIISVVILLFLLWSELAVGIFGTPFAGN